MAFQGKGKTRSELRTAGSSVETPAGDVSGASRGDLGEERPPHGVAEGPVSSKGLPPHRKSLQTHEMSLGMPLTSKMPPSF